MKDFLASLFKPRTPRWDEAPGAVFDHTKDVTLPDLINWLDTQDEATEYSYIANKGCLLFKYLKARGVPVAAVSPSRYRFEGSHRSAAYPDILDAVASGSTVYSGRSKEFPRELVHKFTYGDAKKRAKYAHSKGWQ